MEKHIIYLSNNQTAELTRVSNVLLCIICGEAFDIKENEILDGFIFYNIPNVWGGGFYTPCLVCQDKLWKPFL